MNSILTKKQVKKTSKRSFSSYEKGATIQAEIRYDDECGNGHNSFAITGTITGYGPCGCIHEEIEKHFPELKKYIKWHLMNSDGPWEYIANTTYLASNKDCWGRVKDEPCNFKKRLYFGGFPIQQKVDKNSLSFIEENELLNAPDFWRDTEILNVPHAPDDYKYADKYQLSNQEPLKWYQCPFDTEREASEFIEAMKKGDAKIKEVSTGLGEGKEPELESARNSAIWPDATLEQLQDKEQLKKRLPALMEEFKADLEELGFIY